MVGLEWNHREHNMMLKEILLILIVGVALPSMNSVYCERDKPNNVVGRANDNDIRIGIGLNVG